MSRLDFQRAWAVGSILNIGCGDDPAGFGARAVHLDIDWWMHPNFVQGDCHKLPFVDGAFDTAVLGDVLEHCESPEVAVMEAARVARRVVITVPEETLLPSTGQHIALGIKMRADHYRAEHDWPATMSDQEVLDAHKRTDARFIRSTPESVIAHDGHINRFDEAWIQRLIAGSGKPTVVHFAKVPECHWHNWLIVLE